MQQFYLRHSDKQLNKPFEMVLLWQALLSHTADILTLLLQAEVILISYFSTVATVAGVRELHSLPCGRIYFIIQGNLCTL